jgi:hypothetical protein
MGEPFHTVCVTWDFDEISKCLYFNSAIDATGQNICLSFNDSVKPFYEINTQQNTEVFISEAQSCKPLFLECASTPFLYIRNIGNCNLTINAVNSGITGNCFLLSENIINCNFSGTFTKFVLTPKENILLGVNSSQDGTKYFSEGYYPFGFFYNFSGIKDVNSNGNFPSLCFSYEDAPSVGFPLYSYDNYSVTGGEYLDAANLNSTILAEGQMLGCLEASSNYNDNYAYCFAANKCIVYNSGNFSLFVNDSGSSPSFTRTFVYTDYLASNTIGSGDFTIEFFAKTNCIVSDPDLNMFFGLGGDGDNPNQLWIGINVESGVLYAQNGLTLSGGIIDFCKWNHLAITKKDDLRSLWLNGCLVCSGICSSSPVECSSLTIGAQDAGNRSRPFNGCISNFRVITGEAIYTGTQYFVPTDNLTTFGYGLYPQLNSGITTRIFFTGESELDPILCSATSANFVSGNAIFPVFEIFSGFSSNLNIVPSGSELFLLTGKTFTIETVFRTKSDGGTILSYGGGTGGSGCSGDLYNLYLNCNSLIFNWRNLCCASSGGLNCISFDYTGSNNWSGFNNWNYLAVSSSGDCIALWLNGCRQISKTLDCFDFSGLNCSGYFLIGGMHCSGLYLDGAISNLRLINNYSKINPTETSICNVLDYPSYTCYWTGETGTVLSLNFQKTNSPIDKIKSYILEKSVDDCVFFNLLTCAYNASICDGLIKSYKFGKNNFNSKINLNCIILNFDTCELIYTSDQFGLPILSSQIKSDCNINLYYNISYNNEKYLNYKYCYSGYENDSSQCIVTCSNTPITFSGSCVLLTGLEYNFSGNTSEKFYLKFNLNENASLVDAIFLDACKCNMYLPPKQEFNYDYCFLLGDLNASGKTGVSGYWSTGNNIDYGTEFKNCSKIESTFDSNYQTNASTLYEIDISFSESRNNTCCIQSKTGILNSEFFIPYFSNNEECYYYSGIEFRYFPVTSISYLDKLYEIPNNCALLTLGVSGKEVSFDFPIRALSLDKIKIINNYETFEFIENSTLQASYSNLNFTFSCEKVNCIIYRLPKIKNENLTGFQSPFVSILLDTNSCLQNNLKFIIDPYFNIQNDKTYGLNNFLFFIASELNSGIAYQCNYSDLVYNDSEYNFLMLELQNEFFDCCFPIPTGNGYFIFDERVSFSPINFNQPISYKNISGNGYNYILPISTGLNYSDCTNDSSGVVCSEIIFSGLTNYLNDGFSYCGGSTGVCAFLDFSGCVTGYYTGYLCNSILSAFENKYSIGLSSEDISQTNTGRKICLSRCQTFSGVQPLYLCSNYPFLDIKYPLLTRSICAYNPQNEITGDIFYYIYNINNPIQSSLKFSSPEMTQINTVCWQDIGVEQNYLCYIENNNENGNIIVNAALVKFKITGMISENNYFYNPDNLKSICFNVIGGL